MLPYCLSLSSVFQPLKVQYSSYSFLTQEHMLESGLDLETVSQGDFKCWHEAPATATIMSDILTWPLSKILCGFSGFFHSTVIYQPAMILWMRWMAVALERTTAQGRKQAAVQNTHKAEWTFSTLPYNCKR